MSDSEVRARASQSAVAHGLSTVGARLRAFGSGRGLGGLLAVAGVAALVAIVSRGVAPTPRFAPGNASVTSAPRVAGGTAPAAGPGSPARARPAMPLRDPFRYAEEEPRTVLPVPPRAPLSPASGVAPTPPGIRFLGLVRRGGALKAAVAVSGDIVLVAPGESVAGYVVLSLEEDTLKVRGPEGGEIDLRPAP